ncbi:MAG TPA: tetratricopeptide repeat protein, partial [Phenylobacterium sp.]|nr:tetratricopeptide repeat protein [Phenylobacterium sp.]
MTTSPRPGSRRGRRAALPDAADPAAFLLGLDEAAAHVRAGRLDAAAQVYRRLERQAPGDVRSTYSLAVIDIRQGRLERARQRLEAVIARAPDLAAAQHNLGAVRQRLGAWSGAAQAYGRAVELQPQAAESRAGLAGALVALGQGAAAIQQLRILADDPAQRLAALTRIALIEPGAIGDDDLEAMQAA